MADFKFLKIPGSVKWVISDPNRAKRPNVGKKQEKKCPFCIGAEKEEKEVFRVGGSGDDGNWQIRVIENKYPFAPIHEIVIHSPDHHKNFEELPLGQIELILQTYRARYLEHQEKGQVYIFHNRGIEGGESIPHPHTQIAVVPRGIPFDAPPLDFGIYNSGTDNILRTEHFMIFCPMSSQWPDEVWLAPKHDNKNFGEINNQEISDLAFSMQRIISIFDLRHGHEFPFNFYIYPAQNWYLRIVPRIKIIGGFEIGTGIMVNTQSPGETFNFVKEHFFEPDLYKIRLAQQADYWRSV